jgi:rhomboid family GlyGly-CTERM serine protease
LAAAWVTVAGVVLLTQTLPAWNEALMYRREAVEGGEVWRLLGCHVAHCGWRHTLMDLGCFVLLSWLTLARPWATLVAGLLAAVASGLSIHWAAGHVDSYCGLSDVNYGLLGLLLVDRMSRAWRRPPAEQGPAAPSPWPVRAWALVWLAALVAMMVKVLVETATGTVMVNYGLPPGTVVVGAAHLAGLLAGVLAAMVVRGRGVVLPAETV